MIVGKAIPVSQTAAHSEIKTREACKLNGQRTYLSSVDQRRHSLEYGPLNVHHTPSNQGIARLCTRSLKHLLVGYFGLHCHRCTVSHEDQDYEGSPQSTEHFYYGNI